jgi:DNA replication and repair protein RecF
MAPAEERDDTVSLRYVDSLKRSPDASATPTLEEVQAAFATRLADLRDKEVWNGVTLVGPQRDDLRVLLGGRDVAAHASRGQQRTIILTLKLAETELLAGSTAGAPIVLLDDIFSELDTDRAGRALALLLERGQVLVTAAELGGLPAARRRGVPVWHVADGRLIEAPRVA